MRATWGLLFWPLLLSALPAGAQTREEAAAVCSIPREGKENPADWVKRAAALPFFKGPDVESVPLNERPGFLRKRADAACPLADAWEWGVILGQPVDSSGAGVTLRLEELVGGPLITRFEVVRKNVPGKPGRIVTAPCTHPLVAPKVEYACFDVELDAPPPAGFRDALSGKKLKLVDSWPTGRPTDAAGTAAMKAFCARLSSVAQRKGLTPAQVLAQAEKGYVPEWPVDALLRDVREKPAEEKPQIIAATAEQFGVIGCKP